MLKPIYYPLDKAAEMLQITKEELIHYAMLGHIKIVIPKTDNLCFWIETIDPETNTCRMDLKMEAWMDWLWFSRYHLKGDINYGATPDGPSLAIHKTSLKDIESGYGENDLVLYLSRFRNGNYAEIVKLRNPCTGKPLLIKEAKLYVLAKEVKDFLANWTAVETLPDSKKPWLIPDDRDKPPATEDWHNQIFLPKEADDQTMSPAGGKTKKEIDKERVQEIGRDLIKNNPQLTTAQAKKLPELKPFYAYHCRKDIPIVDNWLVGIGFIKSQRGKPKTKNP